MMKRALVLGASGGMGYSIVKELSRRGIKVIAFARRKEKLDRLFSQDSNVTTFSGDLFNVNDVIQAAEGADVIFQSANIPYSDWETKLGILFRNMIEATKASQAKLVVVDNIYAYGRSNGRIISEDFPKNPHTKKGRIRLQMENLIKEGNVPFLIAHFPDFYGPNAKKYTPPLHTPKDRCQ